MALVHDDEGAAVGQPRGRRSKGLPRMGWVPERSGGELHGRSERGGPQRRADGSGDVTELCRFYWDRWVAAGDLVQSLLQSGPVAGQEPCSSAAEHDPFGGEQGEEIGETAADGVPVRGEHCRGSSVAGRGPRVGVVEAEGELVGDGLLQSRPGGLLFAAR